MTTAPAAPAPDLAAIKQRQQATWASGDYASIGALIVPVAENLCDAADLRAGSHVLDVATGSGNAAIAAARLGCAATGLDYVPGLLGRARERAAAERLDVAFDEGDAENLPYPDGAFDAVLSVFGVMFAPDQERAAAQIARVTRRGGRVGLAAWAPDGFLGDMFRAIGAHVPPPAGLTSPMRWGDPAGVADLFGDSVEWTAHTRRTFSFRFTSADAFVAYFAEHYGPALKAFEALGPERGAALASDLADLAHRWDRLNEDGAIAITGDYLESVAIRR